MFDYIFELNKKLLIQLRDEFSYLFRYTKTLIFLCVCWIVGAGLSCFLYSYCGVDMLPGVDLIGNGGMILQAMFFGFNLSFLAVFVYIHEYLEKKLKHLYILGIFYFLNLVGYSAIFILVAIYLNSQNMK